MSPPKFSISESELRGTGRGMPGGYTRGSGGRYPGARTANIQPIGLGRELGRMRGRGGIRQNQAVYQDITPTQMPQYYGKAPGAASALVGLRAVGTIMQSIENYKAAQDMLQVAQDKRDKEAEEAAMELMEKAKEPLIAYAQNIKEMSEEQGAAYGNQIMGAGESAGLDEQSMNELKLAIGGALVLPSEAEAGEKKSFSETTGEARAYAEMISPKDFSKMSDDEKNKAYSESYEKYLTLKKAGGTNLTVNTGKVTSPGLVQEQSKNVTFLNRVARIKKNFKPEYVGSLWGGDFDGIMTSIGNMRGTLSPEAQDWFNDIAGLRNMQIRIASGATVPVSEVPRLDKEIGRIFDSDSGFASKINVLERNTMDEIGVTEQMIRDAGYMGTLGQENENATNNGGTEPPPDQSTGSLPKPLKYYTDDTARISELSPPQKKILRREYIRSGNGK